MATGDHSRHERLSKAGVEAIQPPANGYTVVWDVSRGRELRGFAVRVNSGGTRAYFAQGRLPNGKEVKPTIGRHGPWMQKRKKRGWLSGRATELAYGLRRAGSVQRVYEGEGDVWAREASGVAQAPAPSPATSSPASARGRIMAPILSSPDAVVV